MRLEQLDLRSRILESGFERIDLRNWTWWPSGCAAALSSVPAGQAAAGV